ncbi:uncharacterized protein LOC143429916 [Xylocopa sonorina]|uniref:uncharacterized protein LOC143429916 n=1 Tax=Xylocopa sonorina TaxID=1818115 RepID=UPI00403AEBF9
MRRRNSVTIEARCFTMIFKMVSMLPFLSLIVHISVSERIDRDTSVRINSDTFLLINPKQVPRLERTVRHFFSKMVEPIDKPIVFNSTSFGGNDLQQTIRTLCSCVRRRLMRFADECGLSNTVQRYTQSFDDEPLSEDWYSEMVLQGLYMARDLGNMINEIGSTIDRYFGGGNVTSLRKKQLSTRQDQSLQFLGVVHDAAEFSESLAECLLNLSNTKLHKSSASLIRSILDAIKQQTPEATFETLKSNARDVSYVSALRRRSKHKPLHVFICFTMSSNQRINYDDCMRDLERLDACLRGLKQRTKARRYDVDVESWTRAIQRLSDCKTDTDGNVKVSCQMIRRIPRKTERKTRYVFERMLDRKVARRPPLRRAIDDLGETLSRSEWGQRFVDELCRYVGIHVDGQERVQKASTRNAAVRHREMLEAMEVYRKGLLLKTMDAINRVHRSTIDFENFFAEGMKDTLKQAWQGHVKLLSSLMDWMSKLLELHVGQSSSGKGQSSSDASASLVDYVDEDSNSESLQEIAGSRSVALRNVDRSMNGLMESMNRLSKYRGTNNKSMLACIANNLLLVTILMETIGFVSSLYCLGQGNHELSSVEFEDERSRFRRSLLSLDYNGIVDLIPSAYLTDRIQ